jgi:hypothetical protein
MKKGDKVDLMVIHDAGENKLYVTRLMISGRVGGKVPPSQLPKGDEQRLAKSNLLNDINNGLDVSDDDITTVFPTEYLPGPPGGVAPPPIPGGLNKEYQAKLDAIREKKAKDAKDKSLKAPTPDKK